MVTVLGVEKFNHRRVANAIVLTAGIGGVCRKNPKCTHYPAAGCFECAVINHVKFIDNYEENQDT